MTYGSCHRMWLSNVQMWLNPYASARFARSTTRADGGVVWSTSPRSITATSNCEMSPQLSASSAHTSRSSCSREAEIDLARVRVRPARRDDLGPGVEVDALGPVHVGVAEQARLPAAEAVVADGDRDRHVDADHPDVDVPLELARRAAVAGEDRRAVAIRVGVDQLEPVVVGGDPGDGQHRAEDLVLVR